MEFGSGTRRRPIGRDYAAAKDAEWGKLKLRADRKMQIWNGFYFYILFLDPS